MAGTRRQQVYITGPMDSPTFAPDDIQYAIQDMHDLEVNMPVLIQLPAWRPDMEVPVSEGRDGAHETIGQI